jgi:hypothetical protein
MSDKHQASSSGAGPLLWVTSKTQSNSHIRTKAEDVAIRKHVQAHLQQIGTKPDALGRRPHRRRKRGASIGSSFANPCDSARSVGCQCDSPSGSSCPSLSRGSSPEVCSFHSQVATPEPVNTNAPNAKSFSDGLDGPILAHFLGGLDPFGSAAIDLTTSNVDLLSHCQSFHVSAAWPRQTGLADGRAADWNLHVNDALASPLYLQALLASGAFVKSRLSSDNIAARSSFLSAQQEAIALLRKSVASRHYDKTTVLAIMQLVSLSYQAGFYDEAIAYQHGAKNILSNQLTKDWRPHEMVLVSDIWLSVGDMELGPFAPNAFDPGPWAEQGVGRHITNASRRRMLPELSSIPSTATSSLHDIFGAIDELSEVYDWLHVTRNTAERSKAALWLHLRSTATKRRLMTYLIFARQAGKKPTGLFKETFVTAVCNGAMCYVNFAFVPQTQAKRIMRAGPLAAYRQILRRVVVEAGLARPKHEDRQLLLWLLFVGLVSETHFEQDTRPEDINLFSTKFRMLAKGLGCSSWADAKLVLQRYLYRAQAMDDALMSLFGGERP